MAGPCLDRNVQQFLGTQITLSAQHLTFIVIKCKCLVHNLQPGHTTVYTAMSYNVDLCEYSVIDSADVCDSCGLLF